MVSRRLLAPSWRGGQQQSGQTVGRCHRDCKPQYIRAVNEPSRNFPVSRLGPSLLLVESSSIDPLSYDLYRQASQFHVYLPCLHAHLA